MNISKALIGISTGLLLVTASQGQRPSHLPIKEKTESNIKMTFENLYNAEGRPDPTVVLNEESKLSEFQSRAELLLNTTSTSKEEFFKKNGTDIMQTIAIHNLTSTLGTSLQELKNEWEFLQKALYIEEQIQSISNAYVKNNQQQKKRLEDAVNHIKAYPLPSREIDEEKDEAYQQKLAERRTATREIQKTGALLVQEADSIALQATAMHPISLKLLQEEERKVLEQKSIYNNENLQEAKRLHAWIIDIFRINCKNELDIRELFDVINRIE